MENADVKKNKTLAHFHSLSVFHFIWQRTHLLSGSNEAALLGLEIHRRPLGGEAESSDDLAW